MEIDEQLDGLTKQARVAVACCCLEHVADLYKKSNVRHVVGVAAPTLKADPSADLFDVALELGWAFAESGNKPDAAAVDAINAGTSTPPSGMAPADAALPALQVLDALETMFEVTTDPTPHAATNLLETCIDALEDMVESVVADSGVSGAQAADQETAWQEKVIERAKQRANVPLTRAVFLDLVNLPLAGQQHVKTYADSW